MAEASSEVSEVSENPKLKCDKCGKQVENYETLRTTILMIDHPMDQKIMQFCPDCAGKLWDIVDEWLTNY